MKKIQFFVLFCLFFVVTDVMAVTARSGRSGAMMPTVTVPGSARSRQGDFKTGPIKLQGSAGGAESNVSDTPTVPEISDKPSVPDVQEKPTVDPMLEEIARQRNICISNNVGISNTFVWADRNSDTSNYAYMIENVENPENNVCFVKVDMRSSDGRVDLSDVKSKYFVMGTDMTCGKWVDEKILEERVLEATKKGRTWGTIAAVVGGAGVGVAAMETFGNKLIGGKVQGQKALEGQDLLRSWILELEKSNKAEYDKIIAALDKLEAECASDIWSADGVEKLDDCDPNKNDFIGLRVKLK